MWFCQDVITTLNSTRGHVVADLASFSNHTFKVEACNSVGCVNSSEITGQTGQAGKDMIRIESHLQYCTLLWANSHVTNTRKLQLLQKKAIRIITSSHYIAHTEPLFSMTKLLKLDDLYKYQLGIFMHKVSHCQLPQNMSSMFVRTDNIHSHQLRNHNAYYIQQIRTNTRKSTINFSGPKFWNTIPTNLRQLASIHQFKKKFKALLLTKYS